MYDNADHARWRHCSRIFHPLAALSSVQIVNFQVGVLNSIVKRRCEFQQRVKQLRQVKLAHRNIIRSIWFALRAKIWTIFAPFSLCLLTTTVSTW